MDVLGLVWATRAILGQSGPYPPLYQFAHGHAAHGCGDLDLPVQVSGQIKRQSVDASRFLHAPILAQKHGKEYNGYRNTEIRRREVGMIESNCAWCGEKITRAGFRPGRFCTRRCKGDWQQTQKPVTREWLYQKYIVEGLGAPDIAVLVSRNEKRVWEWLRGYGIPTRRRGTPGKSPYFTVGMVSPFAGRKHTPANRERFRQARLRDGRVPYLKDGHHHLKGKRGAETPNWKGGSTPERQAFYSSPEWKAAVKVVWRRDQAICRRCALDYRVARHEGVGFCIHHIVGFADKALRSEPSNLALLCRPCHLFVHSNANEGKEFLSS